jgi:superfamily II DNA helicase RecQ
MEAGLARQRNPDGERFRPVVELTAAGVSVMRGTQLPPASLIDLMPKRSARADAHIRAAGVDLGDGRRLVPVGAEDGDTGNGVELDAEAMKRFERLRATRTRLAREQDVPPYVICHDSTLKLIAKAAPNDVTSLERIKGLGPYKIKTYGAALLSAVND